MIELKLWDWNVLNKRQFIVGLLLSIFTTTIIAILMALRISNVLLFLFLSLLMAIVIFYYVMPRIAIKLIKGE